VFCVPTTVCRPLYAKKRHLTSGLSANRYTLSFDLDESRHKCQPLLSRLSFVLDNTKQMHVRVGFSDYKLLIHAAISFFYIILGHPTLISAPDPDIYQFVGWFYIIGSSGCFLWTLVITHFPNYVLIITQDFNNFVRAEVLIG